VTADVRENRPKMKLDNNQVLRNAISFPDGLLGWLESDKIGFTENDYTPEIVTRDAFKHFKMWATDEGFSEKTLPAINGFVQRVIAAGKGITKERDEKRRYFKGLACTSGHFG
jgi:hypothetical protein